MTEAIVARSGLADSAAAGAEVGERIRAVLGKEAPAVTLVFASARHDYGALLHAVDQAARPKLLVGCSSAGEFTSEGFGEGSVSAVALHSDEMRFAAGIGRGLRGNRTTAARELISSFQGGGQFQYRYRSALILTDALAGQADDFINQLNLLTGGSHRLFGGGAGDDGLFRRTHVFFGKEAVADAAVGLEILSNKPVGIGVRHGWQPNSAAMRVTESKGMELVSLNSVPAAHVFEEHADRTRQRFQREDPLPFFLHNVIGIDTQAGHKIRVPLSVNTDGSIPCAADIPTGAMIQIMSAGSASSALAASSAARAALESLEGLRPKTALFFDCVATRLRLGQEFGTELQAVKDVLGSCDYVGCNTYGQIARLEGQFSGFHNCTAVVCVIPE